MVLIADGEGSVEVVFTAWHVMNKMGYMKHVHFEDFNKKAISKIFSNPQRSGIYVSVHSIFIQIRYKMNLAVMRRFCILMQFQIPTQDQNIISYGRLRN